MGAAGSKGAAGAIGVEQPFPIPPALDRDLNKLSQVAARILSTPDIYDVENLMRPGACGDYAIMLKKDVEREVKGILQPFVVQVDPTGKGGPKVRTEIIYTNPRKRITEKVREEICKSLTNSLLRTIMIVVAALASIQVAVPARKTAVSGIGAPSAPAQKGGAIPEVRTWLNQHQYIMPADMNKPVGSRMEMTVRLPAIMSKRIRFYLTLEGTQGPITNGSIVAEGGTKEEGPMPPGQLRAQFLNPITLTGTTQTVLPVRISDAGGSPWIVGVLYENVFKSFVSKTLPYDLTMLLEALFRRTQGFQVDWPEIRADALSASTTFTVMYRTGTTDALYGSIGQFLQQQAAARGVPAPAAPQAYPGYAAPQQQPTYGAAPAAYPGLLGPAAGAAPLIRQGALIGAPPQLQYMIPPATGKSLLEKLRGFREKLAMENSPAAMRAQALAGVVTANRDVQTNLCQDPYWTITQDLSKIYPWATLQMLCQRDWFTTADAARPVATATATYEPEWAAFLDAMASLYNGMNAPRLERTGTSQTLGTMGFKQIEKLEICARGGAVRVKFKEVNDALLRIQGLYERHVAAMWALLNGLVIVVEDPDTRTEHVRLHPNLLKAESAEAYVEERAEQARRAIATFYREIEETYLAAARSLKVVA